jgi:ubiquinone/menaquinone biosynthesis C-methylase UbiE
MYATIGKLEMPESTVAHWDSFWEKKSLLPLQKLIEELTSITELQGKRVLEIGAGSGTTAIKIASLGAQVTCLDYSKQAMDLMRKNMQAANTPINLINGDAFHIPCADESFDICYHQGFLEHFHDITPLMTEQRRILKKGGLLLIDVPQRYNYYTVRKHALIARDKWFAGWETEFSHAELKKVFESNWFTYLKGFGRFHVRHLDRIQDKLLGRRYIPKFIEHTYYSIIKIIEDSPLGWNTAFAVGIIGRKDTD